MASKILCPILRNFKLSFIVPKHHPYTIPLTSFSTNKGFHFKELKGDLFGCEETDALAHCISVDAAMGKGIAVLFKKRFGGVQEIKDQGKNVGEVAVLKRDARFVYYLMTKEKYYKKPTYDTLRNSLYDMKKHCVDNNVKSISMPKIGCGLDKLKWDKVSAILEEVFGDTDIAITVYYL